MHLFNFKLLIYLQWAVTAVSPSLAGSGVTLGLIFNTERVYEPLIMGPPADSNEVHVYTM